MIFEAKNGIIAEMSRDRLGRFVKGAISEKRNGYEIPCIQCGKLKYWSLSRIKRNCRYCSRECADKEKIGKSGYWTGKKRPEVKDWLPTFSKGHIPWNKDKIFVKSYATQHYWVRVQKGKPEKCEWCGSTKKMEWANLSHEYKWDLDDFIALCKKCHENHDKRYRYVD